MTFDIHFRDFRGFHVQEYQPVRPITILVGENSAGKTSFLAGLKYVQDLLSRRSEPNFNNDPFQLGTFEQIAHFRGGRGGRASEFEISIRKKITIRKSDHSRTSGTFPVELKLLFKSLDSHASLARLQIFSNGFGLESSTMEDDVTTTLVTDNGERLRIDEAPNFLPFSKKDFARYWPFFLRDLQFRLSRNADTGRKSSLSPELESKAVLLSELADHLMRRSSSSVVATSAIRTRPQRTYTPGAEREDGEGSHVPYEIAKRYRTRKNGVDEWQSIKKAIEDFGTQSGMFKEILVKSFGQTASDPFQLQFSSGGPRMNLVDLGYGASQVLPILYSIANAKRGDQLLIQQPEVHLHPQAQAALGEFCVNSHNASGLHFVLETHSDFIVDRIRSAVGRGALKKNDVSILFFSRDRLENSIHEIEIDDRGDPVDPPSSYRQFFIGEQMRVLGFDDADNN